LAELKLHFTEGEIVELMAASGLFNYFNRFNNLLAMEPNPGRRGGRIGDDPRIATDALCATEIDWDAAGGKDMQLDRIMTLAVLMAAATMSARAAKVEAPLLSPSTLQTARTPER